MTIRNNALWNCQNPYQGNMKKVLCVCSAGLLRSPTIAWVLSNRGYNTRAAGVYDYALVEVDEVLLEWANYIVCAAQEHSDIIQQKFPDTPMHIFVLDIPDKYGFRDEELVKIINDKLDEQELPPSE